MTDVHAASDGASLKTVFEPGHVFTAEELPKGKHYLEGGLCLGPIRKLTDKEFITLNGRLSSSDLTRHTDVKLRSIEDGLLILSANRAGENGIRWDDFTEDCGRILAPVYEGSKDLWEIFLDTAQADQAGLEGKTCWVGPRTTVLNDLRGVMHAFGDNVSDARRAELSTPAFFETAQEARFFAIEDPAELVR